MYPELAVVVHLHVLVLVILLEFLHLVLQALLLIVEDVGLGAFLRDLLHILRGGVLLLLQQSVQVLYLTLVLMSTLLGLVLLVLELLLLLVDQLEERVVLGLVLL